MLKSVFGKTGVLVVAIIAVSICAVGYQIESHRQYQQRVVYAKSAVPQENKRLNSLEKQVNSFYQDDKKKQFINQNIKAADVTKVKAEVDGIKVTAADFNIKKKSLPSNIIKLSNKKKRINKYIDDVSFKLELQDKVNNLFTKDIDNWQKFDNSMVITNKLSMEQIGDITDELDSFSKGRWKNSLEDYVKLASNQVELVETIQKKVTKYKKQVITYDQYLALVAQSKQIDNEKIRESFKKDFDKFAERVGASSENDITSVIDNDTEVNENSEENPEIDTSQY